MEHFSEQAWADFARGFDVPGKAQGINAHLTAGCLDCKAVYDFWEHLQAVALAESAIRTRRSALLRVRIAILMVRACGMPLRF